MRPLKKEQLEELLTFLQGEDEYIFFDTVRSDRENISSLLFLHPQQRLECYPGDDPGVFFAEMQAVLDQGHYLAGWMSYELGYLLEPALFPLLPVAGQGAEALASFTVFSEPLLFDHRTGRNHLPGCLPEAINLPGFQIKNLQPSQSRRSYLEAISRIREYIAAGDTYQVNYTLKLLFDFSGSAESLYQTLRRNQSVAYGALMRRGKEHILSLSPELFFRVESDSIAVRPMKGTMKRGRYMEEDDAFCRMLQTDIKNRSENVMIVDLLRNDLGRLMRMLGDEQVVTTSLFDVERYESLLQMTSTIRAETDKDALARVSLFDLFRALFPCGSVTGAPKIRTMEIIRELEEAGRGVYTGAIGYLSPAGKAVFNVPIRTIRLVDGKGEMGIGSGIVYDSDPEQEWAECLLKGHFLTQPLPDFYLIETLLWQAGQGYWLLEEHLERLQGSALFFCFSYDREKILACLNDLSEKIGEQCARIRLTLFKDGTMQSTSQPCDPPRHRSLPDRVAEEHDDLPCISLSAKKVDSSSPWYFHKTSRRDLFQEEFARTRERGLFDVCFLNEREELTEGCISNLILSLDGKFVTPPIASGLLAGTMRKRLLQESQGRLQEQVVTREDLYRADGLFCSNSVRGVVQVRLADQE
ncbi:MAG: aminodeoxychorismate synthase component I [Proteobacteria bacterium]|nr:aminodeoxychorismate synthase component I [Pseudomonadota bacterium]MBU1060327.1 aminodeoxychorismate synthase component I [Pseudomonadota bacterium]